MSAQSRCQVSIAVTNGATGIVVGYRQCGEDAVGAIKTPSREILVCDNHGEKLVAYYPARLLDDEP